MLGIIEETQEEPKEIVKKRGAGRPALPDDQKKKHHTIKVTDQVWSDLKTIGGDNVARAIEELVADHWDKLKELHGKN